MVVLAGAALVATGACGGDAAGDATKETSADAPTGADVGSQAPVGDAAPAGEPAGTLSTKPPGSMSSGSDSGAGPSSGGSAQAAQQETPTPLEVSLAAKCVKVGGTQTITIKAPADSAAGYDSYYSDGKSGTSKDPYGGNNGANIPANGTWSDTWTISPTAPPGQVKVLVQAIHLKHSVATAELSFELVPVTGTCP